MVKTIRQKIIFILFLGSVLSGGGCGIVPNRTPATLEEFRGEFPKSSGAFFGKETVLTLAEAQKHALKNNPDYRSMFYAVNAARYRYYQSMSAYLPKIDYNFGIGQSFDNNHDNVNLPEGVFPQSRELRTANSFTASYLLFDGLAREFSVLIAQRQYRAETASDENVKRLLLRGVAYAYYDIILARERENIARANMDFQISSLAQAENRYQYGYVSKASVLNFKILAAMARSNMLNARYQGDTARYALLALMGFSTEELPPNLKLLPLKLQDRIEPPGMDFYLETAIANRPDLKEYRLMLEIARYRKFSAFSPFLPVISAYAGFRAESLAGKNSHWNPDDATHDYYNNNNFNYGIQSSWNLFNGFRSVQQVRIEIEREQVARFQLENNFLSIINEVQSAYANYRNSLEQVKIFHEMLQWVFEQRNLVQVEYWGGNETITRLNGAQSDLVEAESKLAIALIDLEKSIAQLNAAVNLPLQTDEMHSFGEPSSGTVLEDLLNRLNQTP